MRKRFDVEFLQMDNKVATFITDTVENLVVHDFIIPNTAMSENNSSIGFDNYKQVTDYIEMKFGNVEYGV